MNGTASMDGDMNELLKHAFELVDRGKREIKVCDEYKNIVLVLGSTGAGKSTFTQWLAGDNSKLMSKEIACGEFLIIDNDRIGKSTINSQTIFPELVIDTVHNTAFYDCPGFGDTRSTSYDLATTCLIKKVADYADSVKLIFVIRHPSVRKGVDREDFMKLMKHVTDLVKDIDKFKNSIALVITKVDNAIVKQGENYTLVKDELIIAAVADFLSEVKQDLLENIRNQICTETMYYKNAIKIIDILLTKLRDTYTRLGLFRRPDESATLDKIISYQKAKQNIQRMVFKTLDFAGKTRDDFGYGLSEKSKNEVNDIVEEINEKFWSGLRRIASHVEEYFRRLSADVHKKIQLFATATESVDAAPEEAKIISSKFRSGPDMIVELVKRIKDLGDLEQIVLTIKDVITHLGVAVPPEIMSLMINQGKYLNFLQTVSQKELNTRPWEEIFKDTLLFFKESENDLKNNVETVVEKLNGQIISSLNTLTKLIEENYNKKLKSLDVKSLLHKLSEDKNVCFNKMEKIKHLTAFDECLEAFGESLGGAIPQKPLSEFERIIKCLLYLEALSGGKIKIETSPWLIALQDIVHFLQESESWYKFLLDLYVKFSEYKIQKEKHVYNVEKMEDWGMQGRMKGIKINAENFISFLDKISNFSVAECDAVRKLKPSETEFQELNHVLCLTLKSKAIVQHTETTLTIQGDYISLRNALSNESNAYLEAGNANIEELLESEKLKRVTFYSNTIFFDRDLEIIGRQVTVIIIAQKWEIIGSRKIDLRGGEGDQPPSMYPSSAKGNKANNGEPGKPGGSGGHFFGIGEKFINGENLSILVDGGKGGPGQKGQDGEDGKDATAETVKTPTDNLKAGLSIAGGVVATPIFAAVNALGLIFNPVYHRPLYPTISGLGSTMTIGKRGGRGQEGGDGGRGGEGGYPGKITLLELGKSSGVKKSDNKGDTGENGAGGKGGKSGMNAPGPAGVNSSEHISSGRDSSAEDGRAGANSAGLKPAVQGQVFQDLRNEWINEYKAFLEENITDRFKRSSLGEFLHTLNTNAANSF